VTRGTLLTMLPFASALAIASLGQTLVVMQGESTCPWPEVSRCTS
jgi:hypothetical protein